MLAPFFEMQLRDVVDILVVTCLVYLLIVWIRRARAALVAGGILLFAGLYVGARLFDLRLTIWIMQSFFAAFLIVVVVIFQEEIRQFFEGLAVWSLRRHEPLPQRSASDVLVRCLADFARDRIGALVVLPGRQPLTRHLDGGIELGGRLSIPLLKSLFDPHSPGHDGAVVIDGDRIKSFAVHLPLSKNFALLSGLGTRHSAALGLSELSDAMCLVVSEERGTISVAHRGHLQFVKNSQEVGWLIDEFAHTPAPPTSRTKSVVQLFRKNWIEKLISFVLVVGLWYALVPGSRMVQNSYLVPVTLENLPADLEVEAIDPPDVDITLGGPARAFYLFDKKQIKVRVDVTLAQLGRRTFQITDQNVRRPTPLTVEDIAPSSIKISVQQKPPTPAPGATPNSR